MHGACRRTRRPENPLRGCRDGARARRGASGPGRKAWAAFRCKRLSLRGLEEAAAIHNDPLDCFAALAMTTTGMRPEILNPLFTEVEALKGVGPQVAKLLKRLDLTRVVDLLYHLPTGAIERVRAPAASSELLGRNVILDLKPFEIRENRSGRGPMRVFASDSEGNTISLIYFN